MLSAGAAVAREWTVDTVLRQIDKAAGNVDSLTGQVTLTDQQASDEVGAIDGKASIRMDGFIQFEGAGDAAMIVICAPTKLSLYDPAKSTLTGFALSKHPEKLAQYAQIGFSTRGGSRFSTRATSTAGKLPKDLFDPDWPRGTIEQKLWTVTSSCCRAPSGRSREPPSP